MASNDDGVLAIAQQLRDSLHDAGLVSIVGVVLFSLSVCVVGLSPSRDHGI